MSGRKKGASYRLIGGDDDGAIYDDILDEELDALRKETGATALEKVDAPPSSEPPEPEPAPVVGPSVPRTPKPTHDVDVDEDDASVDPEFVDGDEDDAGQPGYTPSRAPGVTVTRQPIDKVPPPYVPGGSKDPLHEPDTSAPWMENALDSLMGFASGATLGAGDEIAGLADKAGLYDALGLGDVMGLYRDEARAARERSPWLYHGAEMLGGTPSAIAAGSLGVGGSAALGAVQGAFGSDADNLQDLTLGGARGALMGGVLHGMGEGAGAVSVGAKRARPVLQSASNEARNAVIGEPGDFRKLADQKGLDFTYDGPAETVSGLGMTNRFWPQSTRDYADKATFLKKQFGEELGDNLEAAGRNPATHVFKDDQLGASVNPPPMPRRDADATVPVGPGGASMLADELLGHQPSFGELPANIRPPSMGGQLRMQEKLARGGTGDTSALADRYGVLREKLDELPNEMLTPKELNELKSKYYDESYNAGIGGNPDTVKEQAAANAGRSANMLLREGLQSEPTKLARYEQDARNFGDAALIEGMAQRKAAGTQGQAPATGLWDMLTRPFTKSGRAADFQANLEQLGADAAEWTGDALTAAPDQTLKAAALQTPRALARGAAAPAEQLAGRSFLQPSPPQQSERGFYTGMPPAGAEQRRDLDLSSVTLQAIADRPQVLGHFLAQLQTAASSPDPGALNAEIIRLVQTSPQFRAQVLPQL